MTLDRGVIISRGLTLSRGPIIGFHFLPDAPGNLPRQTIVINYLVRVGQAFLKLDLRNNSEDSLLLIQRQGFGSMAFSEPVGGFTLPVNLLAHNRFQHNGLDPVRQQPEGRASLNRLQLMAIPHGNALCSRLFHQGDKLGHPAAIHHPRFIQYQYSFLTNLLAPLLLRQQELVQRHGADARPLDVPRSLARRRKPQDAVSSLLPSLPGSFQGGCLASPRKAHHARYLIRGEHMADGCFLVRTEATVLGQLFILMRNRFFDNFSINAMGFPG